jgi:hypothetical protein
MRADEPIDDDPVIRKVAAARPRINEDDLSPDGRRARAIRERVLTGPTPALATRPHERRRWPRGRWIGALGPGLGLAATVAVVIAIVVIVGGAHVRTGDTTPPTVRAVPGTPPPAPTSLLPAHGGMRGLLSSLSAFGSGSRLNAIFEQCAQCRNRLRGATTLWSSQSTDSGRTWRTARVSAPKNIDLGALVQSGDTVWTSGDLGDTPTIFVSHDGGRSFAAATTAATPASQSQLTIDDGTVWALGNRCDGHACRAVVLSGPVGGDRLTATASQPALRPHVNGVQAMVEAHGSTVVATGGFAATDLQTFISHNAGRSWSEVSYPCDRPVEGDVYLTSDRSLWAVCLATRAPARSAGRERLGTPRDIIRRSNDSGRHWTTTATLTQLQPTLTPVTDEDAWMIGFSGTVKRTTDGGRTWQTVLQAAVPYESGPQLVVQDARTAAIVITATTGSLGAHDRRTELVAYRTTDGGTHWTPTVITLPRG